MRRISRPGRRESAVAVVVLAVAVLALLALSGCVGLDVPTIETQGAVNSTGTVQADLSPDATGTVEASLPVSASPTASTAPATPTLWPAKVGTFARNFKKPVWYPSYVPKGYKLDSVDIVEMDTNTGLVCDIVFLNGDKALILTQGSPKERSYAIVSAGKIPWGTTTADIMLQDPQDPASPPIIVYSAGGTFIELQGDPSLDELKKVAASMVPVK
jgi:hypothetical protein